MRIIQWQRCSKGAASRTLFLAVCFALGMAPSALAGGEPISRVQLQQVIKDIPSLSEVKQSLTTAEGLPVQQPAPSLAPAQVTGVQLKPTAKGLEVILETTSEFAEVLNSETENSLITDIPNAQLRLPKGGAFRQDNPTQDIASVEVTNLDAKTLRVTVTGKAGVPTAEVSQSPQALILSVAAPAFVAPPAPTPQPPLAPPIEPQQPEAPDTTAPEPQAEEERLELTVTAEEEAGGYFVPDTSTATKTDTPIRDIPQSIQVVPQQVLQEQQASNTIEALRNVSGVTQANSFSNRGNTFTIRGFGALGFDLSSSFLRNGLKDPFGQDTYDLSNIERIEVLKGPASVLFGAANPGGTINLITKQPLRDPFYSVEATIGSYDFYRGAIDLSGPLNDSKTVLYRLNASYRDRKSFIDFFENQTLVIAPVLSWDIGARTNLTFEGEFIDSSVLFSPGIPAVGTIFPNPNGEIPRNRFTGDPDGYFETRLGRLGYTLRHEFSDNWSFRNDFRVAFRRDDVDRFALPTSLAADNRTLERRSGVGSKDYANAYDLTADLTGKFSTGSIAHQLLLGVELGRFDRFVQEQDIGIAPSLDLFNPVYNQPFGPITSRFDTTSLTDALGIYLQDQVTLAENLKLLLGGRFDTFKQTNEDLVSNTETDQSGNAFSPRVGIVYQPIEPISLYASYSRSFAPTIGTSFDSSTFQPGRGTQYEVGVKADLNNQLSATLAFYDLTRSNVLVADPVNEGFFIQTGKQRSRGIELNVGGEILPGWSIIGGYAYTDAQVTEDTDPELVDKRLNNVPKNAFNVWTTYEIQQGTLQGLGAGLGFFFVGDREGDLANTFVLPSYFRTDAAIFYKRNQFRAALNFKNLFNVDYFEASASLIRLSPAEPFTVQGTVSWQF